jgi:hypothetical protein
MPTGKTFNKNNYLYFIEVPNGKDGGNKMLHF